MALTKADRDAMPESDFAFPRTRQGPMPDETHVKMAWDMIDRTKGVTDDERKAARDRVLHRAKALGVDTSAWRKLKAMSFEVDNLDAMALILPDVEDHPNRMPFSGVLTKLDQPSDRPVHGSLGKLVVIPRAVAEAALPSLLGMAVDFTAGLDGHDPKQKIGIITAATIDGDDLRIEGFLYAADFPEEAALIKARKSELGFSYETAQNFVESLDTEHLVLAACTFTGAAILRKDKAAYQTTSLAAAAAGDLNMTEEELKKLLAEATAPLQAQIEGLTTKLAASEETRNKIEPHAKALEACAGAMEAAAVGGHPHNGHVAVLRRMADSMRAEAAVGKVPHIYRDHDYAGTWAAGADGNVARTGAKEESPELKALRDQLASISTKMADLKAAAADSAKQPERKTIPPQITQLLAKAGMGAEDDGKVSVAKLDAAMSGASMDLRQRMVLKQQLIRDNLLAA